MSGNGFASIVAMAEQFRLITGNSPIFEPETLISLEVSMFRLGHTWADWIATIISLLPGWQP